MRQTLAAIATCAVFGCTTNTAARSTVEEDMTGFTFGEAKAVTVDGARELHVSATTAPEGVTAEFELWLPEGIDRVRGLIAASKYQAGTRIFTDPEWRALAARLEFGILRHKAFREQGRRNGPSWDADAVASILEVLRPLAEASGHPELEHACMIHTGLSWSGSQCVGLAAGMPERTIAVVSYHSRPAVERIARVEAAFGVPLLQPLAEYDQFFSPKTGSDLVLGYRARGAIWGSLYQPGEEHQNLGTPEAVHAWVEDIVAMRLPAEVPSDRPARLRTIDAARGWLARLDIDPSTERKVPGDAAASIVKYADAGAASGELHWLPTERAARMWLAAARAKVGIRRLAPGTEGSEQKPVKVSRSPRAFAVDGDMSKWEPIPPLPAPFADARESCLRLCWSDDGIHGAMTTADAHVESDPAAPWKGDCFEVFIEKDFARKATKSKHSRQFIFSPVPARGAGECAVWGGDGKVKGRWKPTADGYAIEFFIPAKSLEPAPLAPGTRLGFNFCLNDEGEPVQEFYCAKSHGGFAIPALWGAIELAGR